ncbi:MAG: L-serine ammonia-lyase, iron-sulfur-dependent, subunit alpha [Eubacteriaceae bacterium]
MKRQNPSIFNDIVGPTMIGPSSSHTCGPVRIGYLSQQFLRGNLVKGIIEFPRNGAYTNMYMGQRSDMGFISGLLGYTPEDDRIKNAYELMKKRNIEITFEISEFEPTVPNLARLTLWSDEGEEVTLYSDSTGGGTVKLLKVNDFEISIVGDSYELLCFLESSDEERIEKVKKELINLFEKNEGCNCSKASGHSLINIKLQNEVSAEVLETIKEIEKVREVKIIKPVLAVLSNRNVDFPFVSAKELLESAEETGKELWELGIEYEMIRSGWDKEAVLNYMEFVVKTMENSAIKAIEGEVDMNGVLKPTAGKIDKVAKEKKTWIDMGVLNTAVPWSMASMEYSSGMGVVLCAPTGGSAGVMPGAILGVAKELGLGMEEKIKAMFVTSIIGIVMSKDYNYSAELYGCQVEPGAASAMAAAGLVYLMGGTPKQSMDAASCGLQNILGTICDPVAGLVQLPCISRNAMSAANAVVSANIVMGGYDPLIPLDESAETMFRVGKQLPSELRCTCKGGLCTTPTGIKLAEEQELRNKRS